MARRGKVAKAPKKFGKRETRLAVKIAKLYLRKLKAKNIYARPWIGDVEQSRHFANFVAVARIVKASEEDGGASVNYRDWVRAQFEAWNGPKSYSPTPAQLQSEGAFDRYNHWLAERMDASQRATASENDDHEGDLRAAEKALKRMCHDLGLSERKVLIKFCTEFTSTFLKHKGVWRKVRERYREWEGKE